MRPEEIVDGNPKLTLGLIWTIILNFQVSFFFFILFILVTLLQLLHPVASKQTPNTQQLTNKTTQLQQYKYVTQ